MLKNKKQINKKSRNDKKNNKVNIDYLKPTEIRSKLHDSGSDNIEKNSITFNNTYHDINKNNFKMNNHTYNSNQIDLSKYTKIAVNTSLFKRFVAFLIDFFVIILILIPVYDSVININTVPLDKSDVSLWDNLINFNNAVNAKINSELSIITTIIIWLYFAILESIIGQTLGKALVGVYVVSLKNKNGKVNFFQSTLRVLFFLPLFNIFLIFDLLGIIFNKHNQRLMELISGTYSVDLINVHGDNY